ncbi:MAG: hypothetical protein RL417_743 [Pseudomonadota bacterium]|jgi:hypothetical protein
MKSFLRIFSLLGVITSLSAPALAQECPTPTVESDGFWRIQLPTVELKLRPGADTSELVLSQVSPLTGETETHRATVSRTGPIEERAALLQVNRYDFDLATNDLTSSVTAVLAAGYSPTGALNIGYGAQEGGFLVLIDGKNPPSGCYPYPENAAFGDWTKAISVLGVSIPLLQQGLATLKQDLAQCRVETSALSSRVSSLESANTALRDQVQRLQAENAKERQAANRRIFDLRLVIRKIFNEAQSGVRVRYPGDRQALLTLRKQFVLARRANNKNRRNSPNVITATRETIRR